jgi:excisionase family DNA binding protein
MDDLLTMDEAAALLRVSADHLYCEARAGNLPVYAFGRRRLVGRADLERYAQSRRCEGGAGRTVTLKHLRMPR